jgi:hydrogenase-1 operon protein HyaE
LENVFAVPTTRGAASTSSSGTPIAVNEKKERKGGVMPSPLLRALSEDHGVVSVDEATIDVFLEPARDEAPHAILFFTGDPAQRSETHDVAIILPQLLQAFAGRLRAAVIARSAEDTLKNRFHVCVYPSLVVTRGGEPLGVLPKVYGWPEYIARIEDLLRPDALPLAASSGPRVRFTFSGRETAQ